MVIRGTNDVSGMQIDLVIDRDDDIINVCEMKYKRSVERMTAAYEEKLRERMSRMEEE